MNGALRFLCIRARLRLLGFEFDDKGRPAVITGRVTDESSSTARVPYNHERSKTNPSLETREGIISPSVITRKLAHNLNARRQTSFPLMLLLC